MTPSAPMAGEALAPRTRPHPGWVRRPESLPAAPVIADAGLRSDAGMAEVEAMMAELAGDGDLAATMAHEHLSTGGKRLRARLALAAMEVLGAPRMTGIGWAAACELLHNATLIHDDLQDGDRTRRGHDTTWVRHGAAQAVNAGDLLLMLPYLAIDRVTATPDQRLAMVMALAQHATATVRGQTTELAMAQEEHVSWAEYLRAVEGKTGALFQLPVEGAALLAGRSRVQARAIADAFRGVGVLFQLQDDVLDLYGEKGRGLPGSDLREGKVSALVVEHLELHPQDGPWLRGLLALPRDETPRDQVEHAMNRFRDGGALERVLARINGEASGAISAPALADEPALRAVAWELVCVALDPISHLIRPDVCAALEAAR